MGLDDQEAADICCMHTDVSSEAASGFFYVTVPRGASPKDHNDSFSP